MTTREAEIMGRITELLPSCRVYERPGGGVNGQHITWVEVPGITGHVHLTTMHYCLPHSLVGDGAEALRYRVLRLSIDKQLTPPRPDVLAALLGTELDTPARVIAREIAAEISEDVACKRRRIEQDLAAAKQRYDEDVAAADLKMTKAASYLEILEAAPSLEQAG